MTDRGSKPDKERVCDTVNQKGWR